MKSATQRGFSTSEFWTMILGNIVALLLGSGLITQSQAAAATSQLTTLGSIVLALVSTVAYCIGRNYLKAKLGPLPTVPQALPDTPPVVNSPPSPSYAPASTGSVPAVVLPPDLAGVV